MHRSGAAISLAIRRVWQRRREGERERKGGKNQKKVRKWRANATSALTISGAGIRSTVIIWTGQRNLGGRRNLRDGRGPPPPLRPSATPAGCPNSHSNTPNRATPPSFATPLLQRRTYTSCFPTRRSTNPHTHTHTHTHTQTSRENSTLQSGFSVGYDFVERTTAFWEKLVET